MKNKMMAESKLLKSISKSNKEINEVIVRSMKTRASKKEMTNIEMQH